MATEPLPIANPQEAELSGAVISSDGSLTQPQAVSVSDALSTVLRTAGIDRAATFALLTRVVQLVAAPVTLVLIARFFTPQLQGFYFTFASLLALQSFVELGFNIVITNVTSHEWSSLSLDGNGRLVGDASALSRLVSLGHLIFKWYAVASALFIVAVGIGGYVFFSHAPHSAVSWRAPWLVQVILTGILLWMLPFNALLEGCNQVATVNQFRLSQALLANLALWSAILLGAGLWAAAAWTAASVLRDVYLLNVRYRQFFRPFFRSPTGPRIRWRTEIWPMQWRLALSGIANYFAFSLFTPVMFHYHGPVVAGQMGMTLAAVNGLQSVAVAFLSTKTPRFGMLISQRKFRELDRLFLRTAAVAMGLLIVGAASLWLAVYALNVTGHPFAQRLLPPTATGVFLLTMLLLQLSVSESIYLRAHKQEPIVVLSVTSSLAIGLLVWAFGARFGPIGAAWSFLGVYGVAIVWQTLIWRRCRGEWHGEEAAPSQPYEQEATA